jgi:DNA-binding CsgD family transcriptional regulator
MPGKVSRGSLHERFGERISPFGRFVLDKLDRGVVLLDRAGSVIDASTLGQRALGCSPGMLVRNGRLAFADPAIDERFVRWLGRGDGAAAYAITVRSNDAAPCHVVVSAVDEIGARRDVAFIAIIYCPQETREIGLDVLTQLYGLTRAQADVARALYAGYTVDQTAKQLELSRNTVRTHLKQIFSKCEVRSQAELRHVLATGPRSL